MRPIKVIKCYGKWGGRKEPVWERPGKESQLQLALVLETKREEVR